MQETKTFFFNNKILNNKASLSAFELFYQKAKIITNVGSFYFKSNNNNDLRAISSTAAHSSLSIDDRNNIESNERTQSLKKDINWLMKTDSLKNQTNN